MDYVLPIDTVLKISLVKPLVLYFYKPPLVRILFAGVLIHFQLVVVFLALMLYYLGVENLVPGPEVVVDVVFLGFVLSFILDHPQVELEHLVGVVAVHLCLPHSPQPFPMG